MANDVTKNPLILDTAADNLITESFKITKIKWDAADALLDVAQLEDKNERIIWKHTHMDVGTAANVFFPPVESDFNPPLLVDGLSLGTLDGGVLYVYYEGSQPLKTT